MKKIIIISCFICLLGCQKQAQVEVQKEEYQIINPQGETLETRIKPPKGYQRTKVQSDSLTYFLRSYELKEHGSPVLLYNGEEKGNQNAHIAVMKLPIENADLQQCADSIMRVYAEYYYHQKQYDKIGFHFVNGFYADYSKWRSGYKIAINGNQCSWVKTNTNQKTYQSFQKYLRIVFSYASTLSMDIESKKIDLADIQVGDVFLKGGSPGHVVMIVDMSEKDGKKAFLLAQGYMPAQEFHIIKNPRHDDPWYYEEEVTYPFVSAEYTFYEGSLRHLEY